jgi:hypothetical protein
MLLGSIIDQDIEASKHTNSLLDGLTAELFVTDIPGNQQTLLTFLLDLALSFLSIVMLIEIGNGDISALFGKSDSDGSADPAITPSNKCGSVAQLTTALIRNVLGAWQWRHLRLNAWLLVLLLWRLLLLFLTLALCHVLLLLFQRGRAQLKQTVYQ